MKVSYHLGGNGEFVVRNYNFAKPFSGFLPGIAGIFGRPMWVFYVNRAQCICSMGVGSKDGAILEFQSANKAYVLTNTHGFRTFIWGQRDSDSFFYEPFTELVQYDKENLMSIGSADLCLEEKNRTLGLDVMVRYFCIPNEPFSALARELTIKNTGTNPVSIELLDGLPFILPYGPTERQTKDMSHTIQAWMHVVNLQNHIPLYKLKVVIADKPVVTKIEEGNFWLGYHFVDNQPEFLQPIVDPSVVFGPTMDLRLPNRIADIPQEQTTEGIAPSCMGYLRFGLEPGAEKTIYILIGHTDTEMVNRLPSLVLNKGYFNKKLDESNNIIQELQNNMFTESSCYPFNLYCKNTFLDNILRGGFPVTLLDHKKPVILHLYSRRHGDVERDYNKFLLQPTYYSQGDGNYRDVCQNRRNDIWFNPLVLEDNIKTFVNLIQLDGYNPLQLLPDHFVVMKVPKKFKVLADFIKKPFTIGGLLDYIERAKIKLDLSREELIKQIVSIAQKETVAVYKEGYWIDHWTYIADLLESYRSIYPDRYWDIFFQKDYTFYDSHAVVVAGDDEKRRYNRVIEDREKLDLILSRKDHPNIVRTKFGRGEIYKTTLLAKLLCIIANKYATLDPFGVGIEMEADKPGWYDALNGLPGLCGSSTCETFELKRLVLLVLDVLENSGINAIVLPIEINEFLFGRMDKIRYREITRLGINGKEVKVIVDKVKRRMHKILRDLDKGIRKAYNPKIGLYHTYFINKGKRQKPLPLFLEAQVHALRLLPGIRKARAIYNAVRKNGLYDEKLKMYKVNTSLKNESIEIGRVKVFTPGWLENESIWVHMEYKFLLELLRNGLYEEFFNDLRDVLIPFQKPEIFGRSIIENCSFIVSSAHPDSSLHGVGFLPRLTGATSEFINMWLWMCIGKEPFFVDAKGNLNMRFQPILPDWLFTEEGTFGFNLLGSIRVLYHNPQRKNTFGKDGVKPFRIILDNISVKGDTVPPPYAEQIREKRFKRIDVYLG